MYAQYFVHFPQQIAQQHGGIRSICGNTDTNMYIGTKKNTIISMDGDANFSTIVQVVCNKYW